MPRVRRIGAMAAVVMMLAASACGGGSDGPTSPSGGSGGGTGGGGTGGGSAPLTATITIGTNNAANPREVTIQQGGRVTFVNNNTRPHDMASDPHPSHEDCAQMEQVGFVQPGQSKTSGNFTAVRVCGFHDHNQPSVAGLTGRIIIVAQ